MPRLFCFGLGYTAQTVATRLAAQGWRVAGTVRTAEKAAALRAQGIDAHVFDGTAPVPRDALDGTTHILDSIPPDRPDQPLGDPNRPRSLLDVHHDDLVALPGLAWIGHLSTTGVYGDRAGAWVTEAEPPDAVAPRGRIRMALEARWWAAGRQAGLPVHVFRLSGIYGPGRSVLDQLRAGTARRIHKHLQVFSRIHVQDIATILIASMGRPNPGQAYLVGDDEPAPAGEVVAFGAQLLGQAPPPELPFDTAPLSDMARSFYSASKRISNRRVKLELGVHLAFPTYREGLTALMA